MSLVYFAIGALVGGFIGLMNTYLNKKGENLATHEDIDKLVDQVGAVTKTTKEIETKISSDLWDRQKQWELKREILFDAAKKLSVIENKLLSLQTFWRTRISGEISDEGSITTLERQYISEWQEAVRSFEETETLVMVTCSKETMMAFAELGDLLRNTAGKIVSGDLEIYTKTKEERGKKFGTAKVQIRKELGVKFNLAPH